MNPDTELLKLDLLTLFGVAALLTRVGFTLYTAGMVRAKNSAGAVLRTICDVCVTSLAFWAVGAAFFYQRGHSVIGLDTHLLLGRYEIAPPHLFFYCVVFLTASGAVSGAVAERFRFFPLCAASVLLGGLLFPICSMWIWTGWLSHRGFFDLGGASALHMSAGICAAVASTVVGPRTGKYNHDGSTTMIPGHNVPLAGVGALLMFVGWIPYIAGKPILNVPGFAGVAAANVLLSGAAAGLASMLYGHWRYRKPDIILCLLGFLGGIVAVSAGGAWLPSWAAVIVGAIAGIIVPLAAVSIDLDGRIDDPLGVIAIHGVGGAWGTLAAALFVAVPAGLTRFKFIGIQLVGMAAIVLLSASLSAALFVGMKKVMRIRAREADEFDGLDLAEHDIGAYPDFQQTTIKSYHLREM